jgi:hypothetical protein
MLSGNTKSCGCLKVENYIRYHSRAFYKQPELIPQAWELRFGGLDRAETADMLKISRTAVDIAFREFQRKLDGLVEDGTTAAMYAAYHGAACNEDAIAAQFNLPVTAVAYLLKVHMRRISEAEKLGSAIADHAQRFAGQMADLVREIRTRSAWNPIGTRPKDRIRAGEFTFKELRMENGKVRGYYAGAYNGALDLLSFQIPESIKTTLRDFVALGRYTFEERKVRGRQHRRIWAEKRADELLSQQNWLPAAA